MICSIEGDNLFEVDVYCNQDGGISFEPFYKNQESEGCYATTLETLVEEFIQFQRHGETGRIENAQVGPAFLLLEALERCVRMLEDEIFDD